MKVSELIKKLQRCPQDALVYVDCGPDSTQCDSNDEDRREIVYVDDWSSQAGTKDEWPVVLLHEQNTLVREVKKQGVPF